MTSSLLSFLIPFCISFGSFILGAVIARAGRSGKFEVDEDLWRDCVQFKAATGWGLPQSVGGAVGDLIRERKAAERLAEFRLRQNREIPALREEIERLTEELDNLTGVTMKRDDWTNGVGWNTFLNTEVAQPNLVVGPIPDPIMVQPQAKLSQYSVSVTSGDRLSNSPFGDGLALATSPISVVAVAQEDGQAGETIKCRWI